MSYSLKPWNTFGIQQNANQITHAENTQQLLDAFRHASSNDEPILVIGV